MLLVMMAYSVPKELLHELHHHTDTVDAPFKSGAAKEVGTKHIHCDAFEFNGPVLFYSYQSFDFTGNDNPDTYSLAFTEEYFHHTSFDNFKRGPPAFLIG
jgi:hypothetical protein